MQRTWSRFQFTKSTSISLALTLQMLASSFYLPLPASAEDAALNSAITDGAAEQAGSAANKLLADVNLGEELQAKPTLPESSNAQVDKAVTEAVKLGAGPEADQTTITQPVSTPAATPATAAPATTSDAAAASSVSADEKAKADSGNSDGKQLAATSPLETGEPNTPQYTEVSPDEAKINKEGIGGFVGSGADGELALLEQGFVEQNVRETLGEVIIIDNDEALEMEETIAYEDLPTDETKTKIKSGAQFPVVMVSQFSSKSAKKGDNLQARLKYDLKIADRLVAEKGSIVTGHIDYALPARSVLHSLVSPKRWYRNSGCIGITFDEIINKDKEHIALAAKPARKSRIVRNKAEGRELGVNHDGQITGPWGQQLKYKAVRIGLNFALAPAGVFSFGAMPVALGVIGAINPSFAFMKPVGTNVRHRRIKGFAWGFLSGVPGSWIIEDTVTKGQEAIIKPGDEFLVELKQEFTGEARSEATLLPGSSAKVSGQVVKDPKEAKKSKPKKK